MPSPSRITRSAVARLAGRLRFPWLFLITAALFLLDLAVPDALPLADEILLGLGTVLFAAWRRRKDRAGPGGRDDPADSHD